MVHYRDIKEDGPVNNAGAEQSALDDEDATSRNPREFIGCFMCIACCVVIGGLIGSVAMNANKGDNQHEGSDPDDYYYQPEGSDRGDSNSHDAHGFFYLGLMSSLAVYWLICCGDRNTTTTTTITTTAGARLLREDDAVRTTIVSRTITR